MTLTIPETIRVLLPGGAVKKLALEVYVRGVVAAVLPADAPLEALKAQAVAARTFGAITRRHIERGSDVCTLRHCQLWKDSSGASAQRAAQETRGIVAVHSGRLIDAYYFEHCDGNTRDATGVLIQVPPYLKGVTCPCGFATLKGHGIGMCQRGAQVMARFGDSFDTILKHYFNGITVERALVMPLTTPGQRVAPPPEIPAPVLPPRPETTDRAAKAAPAPMPAKTPRARPSASPVPIEPKPSRSVVSPLPPKGSESLETAKPREVIPPTPTESTRPVEAQKARKVIPTSPAIGLPKAAETPKVAKVAPATQPESPQLAEAPKAANVTPTPAPTEPSRPVEAQKAPKITPTSPAIELPSAAETPKVADVAPATQPGTPQRAESPMATNAAPTLPPTGPSRRVDIPKIPEVTRMPPPSELVRRAVPKSGGAVRTPPLDESTRRVKIPDAADGVRTPSPTELPGRKASPKLPDLPPTPTRGAVPPEPPETLLPVGDLQAEAAWYPIAEDIVTGAAGYEAQLLDETLGEAVAPEPPAVTAVPPGARTDRRKVGAPGTTAPAIYSSPMNVPTSGPRNEVRQLPPAPESMPEEMPFFPAVPPPVAVATQAPPPPLIEEELLGFPSAAPGRLLIDRLPGPRMIAGDLAKPGTIITILDVDGHAVVTVSGAAPHHGDGGFEAPLASHGSYAVTFDRQSLQVDLDDETVFIQLST